MSVCDSAVFFLISNGCKCHCENTLIIDFAIFALLQGIVKHLLSVGRSYIVLILLVIFSRLHLEKKHFPPVLCLPFRLSTVKYFYCVISEG